MAKQDEKLTAKKKTVKKKFEPRERGKSADVEHLSVSDGSPKDINTQEALERWLKNRPQEFSTVIAARAALRVFPLVFERVGSSLDKAYQRALILKSFRTVFLSKTAIGEIANTMRTARITEATSFAYPALNAAAAADAAAFSALTIKNADADAAANAAANAVAHAAYASIVAGKASAAEAFWLSIRNDISWGENFGMHRDTSNIDLMRMPLWLNDPLQGGPPYLINAPLWVTEPLNEFARSEDPAKGPWRLIVDWYRLLLPDNPNSEPRSAFGEEADLEIATKDEEFWDRDPDIVMAEIAEIVGWPWRDRHSPIPKPPSPRTIEETKVVADRATRNDQLDRKPFAEELAKRINNVRVAQLDSLAKEREALREIGREDDVRGDGFAVQLHAPWGAGKTSILKMMEDYMTSPERPANARWVIVNFNAWRHERRNPPWWPLMEALNRSSQAHLNHCCAENGGEKSNANKLWRRWHLSNIWALAGPYAIAFVIFAAFLLVAWPLGLLSSNDGIGKLFTLLASGFGALAAFSLVGRWFVHGAAKNAERHAELSKDPLERVTNLFNGIVENVGAPIAIFIDDLDRCSADFVVDLLEGIQTAFRHENVVYVVAADKNWIKAAFETRYEKFAPKVSKPGQPLGYLFLEKIFQMSVPVPGISDELKKDHVNRLATGASGDDPRTADETAQAEEPVLSDADFQEAVKKEVEDFGKKYSAGATREDINKELGEKSSSVRKAAAAEVLNTSREAEEQQKHLLRQYAEYLPDIPRLMVRMINAFTMRNIVGVLENDFETSAGTLARWTVLEQRYPAVADILIDNPEWTTKIGKDHTPDAIKPFVDIEAIQEIIGGDAEDALTEENIRRITRGSRG